MSATSQVYKLDADHERALAERLQLAESTNVPVVLEVAGERYRLVPDADPEIQLADENDPFANYDPEKVLAAIEAGRGALAGIDVEAFLAEIHEMREQDSSGRPG